MKKIALLFSVIFIAFNLSATNDTVFTQGMSFNQNSLFWRKQTGYSAETGKV